MVRRRSKIKLGKSKERQKEVKLRKNFLPTILIAGALWILLAGIIYFTDPANSGVVVLFFSIFFLACLFTFSMLFASSRRGLLFSLGGTLFLILRYFGIGNLLNFALILGVLGSAEVYLLRR